MPALIQYWTSFKTGHFLDPPSPFADIIYEWTLTIVRQKWNLKIKGQMSNVISRISRWVTFKIWCSSFLCKCVFTFHEIFSIICLSKTNWTISNTQIKFGDFFKFSWPSQIIWTCSYILRRPHKYDELLKSLNFFWTYYLSNAKKICGLRRIY